MPSDATEAAPSGDVELAVEGTVAVLTLAAPERRNALTPAMSADISAALARVEADPSVGALVVEGSGGYFCAGAVREVLADAAKDPAAAEAFDGLSAVYRAFVDLARVSVPTIAAVRGGAVGAGLNLALAADIRVCAVDAVMQSGFLRIGVHPGGGHFQLLEGIVGQQVAVLMTLLGKPLDGTESVRYGLALEALDDELVDGRCRELAAGVRDPELARAATRTLRSTVDAGRVPAALAVQAEQAAQMWSLRRSLRLV